MKKYICSKTGRNIFILSCFFILPFLSFSQNIIIDSLKTRLQGVTAEEEKAVLYTELAREYLHMDLDSCSLYTQKALALCRKTGKVKEEAEAIRVLAWTYLKKQKKDNALEHMIRYLKLAENIGDSFIIVKAYLNMGEVYRSTGEINKAEEWFLKSLGLAERLKDEVSMRRVLNGMGVLEMSAGNFDKAIDHFSKALELSKKEGTNIAIGDMLNNIGVSYFYLGDYDKAIEYQKKATEVYRENAYLNPLIVVLNNIGETFYLKGQHDSSLKYTNQAIELNSDTQSIFYLTESYKNALLNYASKGRRDTALNIYFRIHNLNENLYSKDAAERIAELKIAFETDLKEKQIQLLNTENELKENRIKGLIIGLIVTFLLLLVIFTLYRQKSSTLKVLLNKNLEIVRLNEEKEAQHKKKVKETAEVQPDVSSEKYEKSHLSSYLREKLIDDIKHKFEGEKIYLNNKITLDQLSNQVGSNNTYVSQVINEQYGQNFNNTVNWYRITESQKMMSDRRYRSLSIEDIAYKAGFNSVQVFIKAFKKVTGLTPLYYRKNVALREKETEEN